MQFQLRPRPRKAEMKRPQLLVWLWLLAGEPTTCLGVFGPSRKGAGRLALPSSISLTASVPLFHKYLSPVLVSFSASSGLLTVLKLPRVPGQIESWATESKSKFHQGATRPARDQSKIPSHRSQPFRPVISETEA